MAKGSGALAFVAGLGGGMMAAQRQQQLDKERQEDRTAQQEERDLRLGAARREEAGRIALADAARPAVVQEGSGGRIRLDSADDRDVDGTALTLADAGAYRTAGQTYGTRAEADTAAAAYNAPEAVTLRQATAYRAAGKPAEAMQLENAQAGQKRAAFTFTAEQEKRARELQAEGYLDAARYARSGDAQGLFDTFNKTGKQRLAAVPKVAPREREIPGLGKIPTFDYEGELVGEDGTRRPFKVNSHELSMQALPYDKILELQRRTTDSDSRHQLRLDQMENAAKRLELQGLAAEAKMLRAQAASGGDKLGREERLRFTTLFSDAGRRMSEVQKTINSLRKDVVFMSKASKPGTPEAEEMAGMKANLESLTSERELYRGLLAEGAGGKKPSLADAEPKAGPKPAAAGQPVKVATKAERDKLPAGTRYVGPDGQTYIKQ